MDNFLEEIFNERLIQCGFLSSHERFVAGISDQEYFFPTEEAIEKLDFYLAKKDLEKKNKKRRYP